MRDRYLKWDYKDYKWAHAIMSKSGVSILPAGNLIATVGFGPDAIPSMPPEPPQPTSPMASFAA
jgi:hypothetical protein